MILDREKFLAMALSLAACSGARGGTVEGMPDPRDPYSDPACSGFGYTDESAICVAWRTGKTKPGWVPTSECARWDAVGRCDANLFVRR